MKPKKTAAKPSKDLPLGKLNLNPVRLGITLNIERRDGMYRITSENVPGLYLMGTEWSKALDGAPEVIRQLLRANCGIEW